MELNEIDHVHPEMLEASIDRPSQVVTAEILWRHFCS